MAARRIQNIYFVDQRSPTQSDAVTAAWSNQPRRWRSPWPAQWWYCRPSLAGLLLELDILRDSERRRVSPRLLSGALSGSARLHTVQKKLKAEAYIKAMEQQHAVSWTLGDADFEHGLQVLCQQQLQKCQQRIEREVQEFLLIETLLHNLAGRRTEDKRLLKDKDNQRKRVSSLMDNWKEWRAIQTDASSSTEQSTSDSQMSAVLRAEYPWTTSTQTPMQVQAVLSCIPTVSLSIVGRIKQPLSLNGMAL